MRTLRTNELAAKLEARRNASLKRSLEVRHLLKKSMEADLCFLVDATGSMQVSKTKTRFFEHHGFDGPCLGLP